MNSATIAPSRASEWLRVGRLTRLKPKRPSMLGLVAALVLLAGVITGSFFLLRNSSLVAVEQVKVVGLSGYYDKDARAAVVAEAMRMTTLNFESARVEEAAAQFVDVAGVEIETDFPHAATIRLDVRRPVLIARIGGSTVTLSQDGQVMNPVHAVSWLPKIETPGVIRDGRVASGRALEATGVLGAAPDVFLRKVKTVRWGKMGIVIALDRGPDLYFGDSSDAAVKWRDAASVLASDDSRGAAYVDLRVVGRPAVGGIGGAELAPVATPESSAISEPQVQQVTAQPAPAAGTVPATPAPQTTPQAPVQGAVPNGAGGAAPTG